MTDPFEALARMRTVLRDGLGLLDGAGQEDPEVPTALARVAAALQAHEDPAALRARVPEADHERFDDELEELIRLNAILASAASSDREHLVGRLKAVRESRRDLAYYGGAGSEGARCDISG